MCWKLTSSIATFVALILAGYDVSIHHILKSPERQKKRERKSVLIHWILIIK